MTLGRWTRYTRHKNIVSKFVFVLFQLYKIVVGIKKKKSVFFWKHTHCGTRGLIIIIEQIIQSATLYFLLRSFTVDWRKNADSQLSIARVVVENEAFNSEKKKKKNWWTMTNSYRHERALRASDGECRSLRSRKTYKDAIIHYSRTFATLFMMFIEFTMNFG